MPTGRYICVPISHNTRTDDQVLVSQVAVYFITSAGAVTALAVYTVVFIITVTLRLTAKGHIDLESQELIETGFQF